MAAPFGIRSLLSHSHPTKLHLPNSILSTRRLGAVAMSQSGAEESSEPVVQYVVLRRDLIDEWPLGSVVTQGCHASVAAVWAHREDPLTLLYCSPENIDSMHKVTLEVKGETQMLNLSEKLKGGGVEHKVWIEQPENIPTCIATKPYPKSVVSSYFKKLKLCKRSNETCAWSSSKEEESRTSIGSRRPSPESLLRSTDTLPAPIASPPLSPPRRT